MMRFACVLLAAGFMATSSMAQMATMAELDANGDHMVSMEELTAVYKDLSEEQFTKMDANGDGSLDESEMQAAMDNGMLPAKSE